MVYIPPTALASSANTQQKRRVAAAVLLWGFLPVVTIFMPLFAFNQQWWGVALLAPFAAYLLTVALPAWLDAKPLSKASGPAYALSFAIGMLVSVGLPIAILLAVVSIPAAIILAVLCVVAIIMLIPVRIYFGRKDKQQQQTSGEHAVRNTKFSELASVDDPLATRVFEQKYSKASTKMAIVCGAWLFITLAVLFIVNPD
jgi:hypothetical protein